MGAAQGNLLTCGMGYQVVSALDVTYGGVDEVREGGPEPERMERAGRRRPVLLPVSSPTFLKGSDF